MNREVMVKALNVIKDSVVNTDFPLTNKLADAIYAIEVELAKLEREWVGLTDDDIEEAWGNTPMMLNHARKGHARNVFARAIESKLKYKNS
jgi:hypothetical protein